MGLEDLDPRNLEGTTGKETPPKISKTFTPLYGYFFNGPSCCFHFEQSVFRNLVPGSLQQVAWNRQIYYILIDFKIIFKGSSEKKPARLE